MQKTARANFVPLNSISIFPEQDAYFLGAGFYLSFSGGFQFSDPTYWVGRTYSAYKSARAEMTSVCFLIFDIVGIVTFPTISRG